MRKCFACGAHLTPFTEGTWTSHEFNCAKKHPERTVPAQFAKVHAETLVWEKRSEAAKRGAATRRLKAKAGSK